MSHVVATVLLSNPAADFGQRFEGDDRRVSLSGPPKRAGNNQTPVAVYHRHQLIRFSSRGKRRVAIRARLDGGRRSTGNEQEFAQPGGRKGCSRRKKEGRAGLISAHEFASALSRCSALYKCSVSPGGRFSRCQHSFSRRRALDRDCSRETAGEKESHVLAARSLNTTSRSWRDDIRLGGDIF